MVSTLLKNGLLIDGTGRDGFVADLLIEGERIKQIGNLENVNADSIVDCTNLAITPGFIDVHTHDDSVVIESPDVLSKISQGVTSVITGNCGISLVPYVIDAGVPVSPLELLGKKHFCYDSLNRYADAVNAAAPSVNVGVLIGHTSLRASVMADFERVATKDEISKMVELMDKAMIDGALGLSSGTFYHNAFDADEAEIIEIARVSSKHGGVYTSHIRSELEGIMEAIHETAHIAHQAQVPLVISHHKCASPAFWGRTHETLSLIDRLATHQPISMDVYPYTAGSTVLREDLVDGIIDVLITQSEPYPEMAGKSLRGIAQQWGISEQDACRRLQPGGACYFQMREDDVIRVLSHPRSMLGSDGLPHDFHPHPRLWGAFPRFLGYYCRDRQLLRLETAISKITSLPAAQFGFKNRGMLAIGNYADVTVFDPKTVRERATYAEPCLTSQGIEYVFVNGHLTYTEKSGVSPFRRGRLIRRNQE